MSERHAHEHDHEHDHDHSAVTGPVAWESVGSVNTRSGGGATVAWFHCFSGVAGDMALGALIDAGADLDEVRSMLARLSVGGWSLEAETVLRAGVAGTKVHVLTEPGPPTRSAADVAALIAGADLPDRVRDRALATVRALAEAEGRLHRQPPASVHLHEVGALDAIIDIVGTCIALELLGVDDVAASPVADGLGTVRAAHGVLPVPVPAVVELLAGAPTYGLDIARELTTPTGAALLAAMVAQWGPLPAMTIRASGFGAGSADLGERPNHVRVVIGTREEVAGPSGRSLTLLETTLDDVTGEVLGHTIEELMADGALDAWITPVVMKKGRPGHVLSALVDAAGVERARRLIVAQTGTLGVRASGVERWAEPRSFEQVEVDGHVVTVKVSGHRVKAEHDEVVAAARALGRPAREIAEEAERRWRQRSP